MYALVEVWFLDGMATEDLTEKETSEKGYGENAITLWLPLVPL